MGMHHRNGSSGRADPAGQADFRSRTSEAEARRSGERLLEIDAFAAYAARGPRPAMRTLDPAGTPPGAPIHPHVGEGPVARPSGRRAGGLRLVAVASVAAVVLGSCLLAATFQGALRTGPAGPTLLSNLGPIDMTGPKAGAGATGLAAGDGSVRQIPLGRGGAEPTSVAIAVPLPRDRPDPATVAGALPSVAEGATPAPTGSGQGADQALVATIEKALDDDAGQPPAVQGPMPLLPPVGVAAAAPLNQGPADEPPLPAGMKLPPEDIPYVAVGSV
jgi:hypothetical protein